MDLTNALETVLLTEQELLVKALVERGKPIYSNKKKGNKFVGVADALEKAEKEMRKGKIIASLPLLIAGKSAADKYNYLHNNWLTPLSEEHIITDENGKFTKAGNYLVAVVHGPGILTSERIYKSYSEGLTRHYAAKLHDQEVKDLLEGRLQGRQVGVYHVDDIKKGINIDPFGNFMVVLDFETARHTLSGWHQKDSFMANDLVIARAGTLEYLEDYFDKVKNFNITVGNRHRFKDINPSQAQGRLLFLNLTYGGLYGNDNLNFNGRFVGVEAPEAPVIESRERSGPKEGTERMTAYRGEISVRSEQPETEVTEGQKPWYERVYGWVIGK